MKKILIVDDSETIRQQVKRTLEQAGWETVEASDGVEGMTQAELHPDIAMALLDVNMPRLNGLDLLEKLRASPQTASVPVLMLTTEAEPALTQRAKKLGAKGWIVKPVTPQLLVNAVAKLAR